MILANDRNKAFLEHRRGLKVVRQIPDSSDGQIQIIRSSREILDVFLERRREVRQAVY
jgi:hypothetical protein